MSMSASAVQPIGGRLNSPWRRGPGIRRLPDGIQRQFQSPLPLPNPTRYQIAATDSDQIAVVHYRNKLLWHAFRQWHFAALCVRLRRLRNAAVALRHRRIVLRAVLHHWRRYTHRRPALSRLCGEVRRLRLSRIEDIWRLCEQSGEGFEYRTALLVFNVRRGQLQLCRRVWQLWRQNVANAKRPQ